MRATNSSPWRGAALNRDRRPNRWMRVVIREGEILEAEIVDIFYRRIQLHLRKRPEIPRELFPRLFEMVLVKVDVAEGVDEFAGAQIADLRYHHGEQ